MEKLNPLDPKKMSDKDVKSYEILSQTSFAAEIWLPHKSKPVMQDLIRHIKYLEEKLKM